MNWIEGSGDLPAIEVVRGRLDRARADELLSFWYERRALAEPDALRRLPEVVCVLRHDGAVAGVSSVYPLDLPSLGGRRFWGYRSLLDHGVADRAREMIRGTFNALEGEFDGSAHAPIGLCLLLAGPEERRRFPEAESADPRMIYAGYLQDGRQVRIAYFEGAEISMSPGTSARSPDPGWALPEGYRLAAFAEQTDVSAEDVIALWRREGALRSIAEAERRVSEVLLVATDADHRPVGISTAFLRRSEPLQEDLWHSRVFVAAAHRRSHLALALAKDTLDRLAQRFASGADRRGIGMIFEIESEPLRRFLPQAVWPLIGFQFIGETPAGSHIRVRYFPGALAPEPGARPE